MRYQWNSGKSLIEMNGGRVHAHFRYAAIIMPLAIPIIFSTIFTLVFYLIWSLIEKGN